MRVPGVPYVPRYSNLEKGVGVSLALLLHVGVFALLVVKSLGFLPSDEEEAPLVARPVVQASLLKLGKPIDPRRLPDRLVPRQRTAPKKALTASREDPGQKSPDAGTPPPNTVDSDLTNLIAKSDPFSEDSGAPRPEEGHADGVEGGEETDRNKVRAGDMFAAKLGQFLSQRLSVPSVISVGEERKLCAVFEVNLSKAMVVWRVREAAVKGSGNDLFDDAVRSMLMKLLDDKAPLPDPPAEVEELYRARRIQVIVTGRNGDPSRCLTK